MLTPRQREIAGLVAQDMSAREIAKRTGISERTVEVHIQQAAKRIGGESAPQYRPRRLLVWFFNLDSGNAA